MSCCLHRAGEDFGLVAFHVDLHDRWTEGDRGDYQKWATCFAGRGKGTQ
jgi:hypothetical protein